MSRGLAYDSHEGQAYARRHHLDHDPPRTYRQSAIIARDPATAARSPNTARTRSRSCAYIGESIATPPNGIPDKQSVPADLHRAAARHLGRDARPPRGTATG